MGRVGRRQFLIAAAAALASRATSAQQSQKPRRIGFLVPSYPSHPNIVAGLKVWADSFRRRGYEDGANLLIEYRYAEGKLDRFPRLAQELVDLNVELIVTFGNVATFAAKRATRTIPIVMASAAPVEVGLIDSYARPGGNLTGVDWWSHEIAEKLYQLLKDAVPGATRAARIVYPSPSSEERYGDEHLRRIRATTGLTVETATMSRANQLAEALDRVIASQAEVLHVSGFEFFVPHHSAIAKFAAERKLVSISEHPAYTGAGGLLHYSADGSAMTDRMASHVDRILRGAKPSDIPVEQPTKFELVLNGKTAKVMGVALPRSLTAQVSRVIE
jgi:putative ABC transport system substrate-binding protein